MKPRAYFEKARHPATKPDFPSGRFRDLAEEFQQRGFAGSVAPDYPHDLTFQNVEGNIFQSPKLSVRFWITRGSSAGEHPFQRTERVGNMVTQCVMRECFTKAIALAKIAH